jgi:hypothetical protein
LKAFEKENKAIDDAAQLEIQASKTKNASIRQDLLQRVGDVQRSYQMQMDAVKEAALAEETVTKQSLDHIMQARRKMADDYRRISDDAHKKADETLQEKLNANEYERGMMVRNEGDARSPADIYELERRARAAQTEASERTATAKDSAQERAAAVAQQHAEAEMKQYEIAAKQLGTAAALRNLEGTRHYAINKQNEALERQQQLQRGIAKAAEDRAIETGRHNIELEKDKKTIEDSLKITAKDEKGDYRLKTQEEYKKDEAVANAAIARFNANLTKYGADTQGFMNDPQAFKAMQRDNERLLAGADLQQVNAAPQKNAALREQLQRNAEDIRIKFPEVVEMETISGKRLEVNGIAVVAKGWETKANESDANAVQSKSEQQKFEQGQAKYWNLRGQLGPNGLAPDWLDQWGQAASNVTGGRFGRDLPHQGETSEALNQLDAWIRNPAAASKAQMSEYIGSMGDKIPTSGIETARILAETLVTVKNAFDKMQALPAKDEATEITRQMNAELSGNTGALKANTDALLSKPAASKAFGGVLYRDAGGEARGTDTIPAMLSPGEMVMNAASSRKFAAQLIAMNAGSQPIYRQEGGSVTNVGDVSITVQESKTPQATARELLRSFQREIRRGSSTY